MTRATSFGLLAFAACSGGSAHPNDAAGGDGPFVPTVMLTVTAHGVGGATSIPISTYTDTGMLYAQTTVTDGQRVTLAAPVRGTVVGTLDGAESAFSAVQGVDAGDDLDLSFPEPVQPYCNGAAGPNLTLQFPTVATATAYLANGTSATSGAAVISSCAGSALDYFALARTSSRALEYWYGSTTLATDQTITLGTGTAFDQLAFSIVDVPTGVTVGDPSLQVRYVSQSSTAPRLAVFRTASYATAGSTFSFDDPRMLAGAALLELQFAPQTSDGVVHSQLAELTIPTTQTTAMADVGELEVPTALQQLTAKAALWQCSWTVGGATTQPYVATIIDGQGTAPGGGTFKQWHVIASPGSTVAAGAVVALPFLADPPTGVTYVSAVTLVQDSQIDSYDDYRSDRAHLDRAHVVVRGN